MTGVPLDDSVLLGVTVGAGVTVSSFVTITVPVDVRVDTAVCDGLEVPEHVRETMLSCSSDVWLPLSYAYLVLLDPPALLCLLFDIGHMAASTRQGGVIPFVCAPCVVGLLDFIVPCWWFAQLSRWSI